MIPRAAAKASATLARPQDLTHPKYWIDIGKNWLKSRPDKIKIFTGFFWKPHRKPTEYANVYKGYRPTR